MATQAEYRRMLQALLPTGPAWPREPDAVLTGVLDGWAEEFARADGRAGDLLEEADPRTSVETLPEWEADLGLLSEGSTVERQGAVVAALNAEGGQSTAYFVNLAAAAGIAIVVTGHTAFRAGYSSAGDALSNGGWLHTWQVTGPAATSPEARAELEALFRKLKPSHTAILFDWSA